MVPRKTRLEDLRLQSKNWIQNWSSWTKECPVLLQKALLQDLHEQIQNERYWAKACYVLPRRTQLEGLRLQIQNEMYWAKE